MIYCPSCGIANREGSRFCNECGAKLPSGTSIRCPQCGTPNAPNDVFCEKCGTRLIAPLVPDEPDEPEPAPVKKGLSLPSKLSVPADDDDIPDWLAQLSGEAASAESSDAAAAPEPGETAADDIPPAWLSNLMGAQPVAEQPPHPDEPPAENAPDWLASLRSTPGEDVPEWLDQLGERQAGEAPANAADEDTPEWLKQLSEAADMPADDSGTALPARRLDWSAALRTASTEGDEPLAEEVPDWLSNLGEASAATEAEPPASIDSPVPEAPVPEAGDLPDWLLGLNQPEAAAPPVEEPPPQTDWLGQLRAAAPIADEGLPVEEGPAVESAADWLSALGADQLESANTSAPQEAAREPVAIEPPSGEGEVPDWLGALGLAAPAASRIEPEAPPEIPAWPAGQPEPPASDQPAAVESAIDEPRPQTDWLGQLRAAVPMADEESDEEADLPPSDLPDWLADSAAEPAVESTAGPEPEGNEIPDWLRDLGSTPTTAAIPPASEEVVEAPDWSSATKTDQGAAPAKVAESASPQTEDEIPDWLRGVEPAAADESLPPSEPEPAVPVFEESEPDWLSAIRSAQAPAESEQTETPIDGESAAEVPDWLKEPEPPAASTSAESAAEELAAEGELPDWLKTLGAVGAVASGEPPGSEEPIGAAEPAQMASAEIPEWLSTLRPEDAAPLVQTPAEPALDEAREKSPDTLRVGEPVAAELPEWLVSLRERKPAVVPPSMTEPVPGIMQGEIPPWLEALRPAEGESAEPALPEDLGEVEQEGIFAGVTHVLPPAPLMGEVQGKPDRLQVEISAEDMTRAGVLQQLLAQSASGPRAAPSLPVRPSARRGLQWLVAVLMLVAVSVPFLLKSGLSILPQVQTLPASPLLQAAVSKVAALPDGARVLVVFDYDASQAGEMNPLADAVLRHLLARKADITATSLNPIGPALAQSTWEAIEPNARTQGQWHNLGYVAGQSIGAQEVLLKSGPVDLVVELAASPDALRWWIEQRGLLGQATPLIAAVSAAAEPLALPYAQSQQVAGLVSGVAGAAVYAREAQVLTPRAAVIKQVQLESLTLANWLMAAIVLIALAAAVVGRRGKGNPA